MSLDFDSARLPNPNLRPEHNEWRSQLRKFIDAEIMPYAQDWDESGHIPIELWPKAAAVGLLGLGYPEEFGGIGEGIDCWHMWIANEELARIGVGGIPASLMVHGIGLPPVINWGSQALKEKVAPPVLAGDKHIALGITEPGGGSDVAQLATTAVLDGDHYIVNGSKTYITGGMRANWVSTAVRTGGKGAGGVSMLLIPTDAQGFSRTQLDKKQGWWASDTATLYFDNVRVPVENLIGEEGSGFRYILDGMNAERILIAAECIGDARYFIDRASHYACEREVFGRAIGQNQGIQFPIARAYVETEAAAGMVERATALFEAGESCGSQANMAKLLASEASWHAGDTCVQTFGGYGFAEEYDIERKFRETRLYQVAPISTNLILSHIATHELDMPRSF